MNTTKYELMPQEQKIELPKNILLSFMILLTLTSIISLQMQEDRASKVWETIDPLRIFGCEK